jgi:hypothetical protein
MITVISQPQQLPIATIVAIFAFVPALLIKRANSKKPQLATKTGTKITSSSSLELLLQLSEDITTKYKKIKPNLVKKIQTDILQRVVDDQLTPDMGILALKIMLISENKTNNITTIISQEKLSGTIENWYIDDHIEMASLSSTATTTLPDCYWGNVYNKSNVRPGSLFHTDGGIKIGNYCFTNNNKIYQLGKRYKGRELFERKSNIGSSSSSSSSSNNNNMETTIEMEHNNLMQSFRMRRSSLSSLSSSDEIERKNDEEYAYRSYLFSHLKSEVIVLDKAGVAFIQREVDQMNMYTSNDPFRGFRTAHQVVKRIVVSVAGPQQEVGERWQLGNSYSDFLNKVPRHQLSVLWDAMRRLVVWYDNLPVDQHSSWTEVELMENLPHLILIARHARVLMGIRSLIRNSALAPSPAHRDSMRRQARQLADLHGQHVQQSNEILRRANSSKYGLTMLNTKSNENKVGAGSGGGRRRRRPSMDDSSVLLYQESKALKISKTK